MLRQSQALPHFSIPEHALLRCHLQIFYTVHRPNGSRKSVEDPIHSYSHSLSGPNLWLTALNFGSPRFPKGPPSHRNECSPDSTPIRFGYVARHRTNHATSDASAHCTVHLSAFRVEFVSVKNFACWMGIPSSCTSQGEYFLVLGLCCCAFEVRALRATLYSPKV